MWEVTRKEYHFDIGSNSKNWQMQEGSHQEEGKRVTLTYQYPRKPSCFQWKTPPKASLTNMTSELVLTLSGKLMEEQTLTSVESRMN